MILPFGGFLTLGALIAFSQWLTRSMDKRKAEKAAEERKGGAEK